MVLPSKQMHFISLPRIDTSRLQVLIIRHLLILIIPFGFAFKIHVRIKYNISPLQNIFNQSTMKCSVRNSGEILRMKYSTICLFC
jgi:hypothetical protein